MSELVGGKCGWTPAVGSGFRCGSASPVCYPISVLGAARRFACENRREPDLGFRCGSASPVCYLISVLGAARRCQWLRWICVGFRCSVRLGVVFVGTGGVPESVFRAAERFPVVPGSWPSIQLGVVFAETRGVPDAALSLRGVVCHWI